MFLDYNIILGLFLGLVAYCLLYLAKGIEKYAIEGIKGVKTIKSRHSGIWVFGVSLNAVYMFMQWAALNYAPVNVIVPLNGIGLVALLLFSYYILKEKITKIEFIGVIIIVFGTVFSSLFNSNSSTINSQGFNLKAYLVFLIVVILIEIMAVVLSTIYNYKGAGIIISLTAGTYYAFETVSKRITAIPNDNIKLLFTIITMLVSCVGFFFTQYALVKMKANIAVPCFTSTSIVFATIIGIVFLNESFNIWSITGITLVVFGIVLLTAFKGSSSTHIKFESQKETI